MSFLYTLSDPKTNLVRYVGKTCVHPNIRYAQHLFQWKRSKRLTHVNSWIKKLHNNNLKPILTVIDDQVPKELIHTREIDLIKLYKACGANLCNMTMGGEGTLGYKHSQDSISKRLSSISKSKLWEEKHIRHSQIMKDKYQSGELVPIAKRLSVEQKKNMARAISEGLKKTITVIEKNTGKVLIFKGYQEFATYLGYKSPTVVRDFILGIRKSKLAKSYEILENKNKYDTNKKNNKKEK